MTALNVVYEKKGTVNANELSELFKKSGINRPYEDLDRMQRMIENSDMLVTARIDGQLVGIARSLTDYSYCCYLSDLAVDKKYQKMGIGKEMVHRTREQLSEEVSLILLSAETALNYYPKIGFDRVDNAFVIKRKR
ncbi:MAG: GNAT family N-acetyltransferase [Candidatus Thermoplasmatota archaeon]|nr:GNAT family N-acetyltransferase [Candidatus Thermoplasmatota archaeon]MDA8143937.1 GNAT family N-acetyltransferase [Thermoplasmatales archaeon]